MSLWLSSYVKEKQHHLWIEGKFSWPENIESPWALGFRLQYRYSLTHINMIEDKHKALIQAY